MLKILMESWKSIKKSLVKQLKILTHKVHVPFEYICFYQNHQMLKPFITIIFRTGKKNTNKDDKNVFPIQIIQTEKLAN